MSAKAKCPTILDKSLQTIGGEKQNLCNYSGKVILAVNTASKCGFTGQYKGLEEIYQEYKDRGFIVLGFPSNDFGGQEPGTNEEVQDFCEINYGVTFPLFAKTSVKKNPDNPLFIDLVATTGKSPKWNFNKYLISRDGKKIQHFGSLTSPTSRKLRKAIEALL